MCWLTNWQLPCLFEMSVKRIQIKFWTTSCQIYTETIRIFPLDLCADSWQGQSPSQISCDRNLQLIIPLLDRNLILYQSAHIFLLGCFLIHHVSCLDGSMSKDHSSFPFPCSGTFVFYHSLQGSQSRKINIVKLMNKSRDKFIEILKGLAVT